MLTVGLHSSEFRAAGSFARHVASLCVLKRSWTRAACPTGSPSSTPTSRDRGGVLRAEEAATRARVGQAGLPRRTLPWRECSDVVTKS